jgi:hypothetical protein
VGEAIMLYFLRACRIDKHRGEKKTQHACYFSLMAQRRFLPLVFRSVN